MTTQADNRTAETSGQIAPVVVPLDELERLFAMTTQGEWRTLADSYTPAEWFVVVGPGIFGQAVIAGPSEAMTANADFDWIAAMHNAFPRLVAALKRERAERAEPITDEWLNAMGFFDDSATYDMKRFELAPGVRVVKTACVGGWNPFEIWTGMGRGHVKERATRGDVVDIVKALGIRTR